MISLEQVYAGLIKAPGGSVADVAGHLKAERTQVSRKLRELEKIGCARSRGVRRRGPTGSEPAQWWPVKAPPEFERKQRIRKLPITPKRAAELHAAADRFCRGDWR